MKELCTGLADTVWI